MIMTISGLTMRSRIITVSPKLVKALVGFKHIPKRRDNATMLTEQREISGGDLQREKIKKQN